MEFRPSLSTEEMPIRWASENDTWEIGLRPMMFGVRVSVGKIEPKRGHAMVYTLDYCAGSDQAFLLNLFATIIILLTALPESITPRELKQLFPAYQIKPINQDPHCWRELQRLAKLKNPFPNYRFKAANPHFEY